MSGKIQVQCQVMPQALEFRRNDDDEASRVVTGPVMVASPAFQSGQTVTPEDLVGVVHFDGAFMTGPEVKLFAHRFLTKRPGMDLEHDGTPRRAWPVESFLSRQADGRVTEGSHIVTALSLDTEVNAAIDAGELLAWSVQLMLKASPVVVQMSTDDGPIPLLLMEFSDGDPQFLSFVKFPAIGANWEAVQRSLSLCAAPSDFSENVARARIFEWASVGQQGISPGSARRVDEKGAVSLGLAAKFFPDFARSGFDHPVGDVIDGNPTIYLEAVRDACALAQGGTDVARVMRVMRSDVEDGVATWSQFVETNLGIPTPVSDSPAPVEEVRTKTESAEPVEQQRSEPVEPVAVSEEVRTDPDGGAEDVDRQAPTFDELLKDTMPGDVFWSKCWSGKWVLTDAFWFTLNDADMTTEEKQAAMKLSVTSFATFMNATIDELFATSANLSADGEELGLGEAMRKLVHRAGAVLSASNKADIELAAEKLTAVLERAKKAEDDDTELSAHDDDDETDLAAHDDDSEDDDSKLSTGQQDPAATSVDENVTLAAIKVALAETVAIAVKEATAGLRTEIDAVKLEAAEAKAEVAAVRSAAPAPASPSAADESALAADRAAGNGEKKLASWGGIVAGTQ